MQAVDEIAKELERQIAETTARIDAHIASQSSELSRAQQEHEALMRDLEAKIQRLKTDQGASGERALQLQAQLAAGKAALGEKQLEIARLEAAASSLPAEVDTARAKEEAAQQQQAAARQELSRVEAEVRQQLLESSRGLDAYARLGLAFEDVAAEPGAAAGNNLRVVFTLIDPAAPARRFTFNVRVSADDTYAITACEPPVATVPALVEQLNATNAFSAFVQQMRREFVALVRGGGGGGSGGR